jgi:hypothetical protein
MVIPFLSFPSTSAAHTVADPFCDAQTQANSESAIDPIADKIEAAK